jgi:hypothetical protein
MTNATNITRTTTAAEAYDARLVHAREMLRMLDMAIAAHEGRAKRDPKNWGLVGDLAHVDDKLTEIAAFLIV